MHCNSCYQNIIYALIIRTKDGMPLSATTDFTDEINKNVKECKRYVKLLSKKAQQFPERCVLKLSSYSIYLISYLGVTYMALCVSSYPSVLAFSFLNELMKEFVVIYDQSKVENVVRPYSILQFDNVIHKTCQRYNKPQSLTTRINLSELSLEMKLRPPYSITVDEINPRKNKHDYKITFEGSYRMKFEDLSLFAFMTMALQIMLGSVSLFRAIAIMHESTYEGVVNEEMLHGTIFLLDATSRYMQICFLLHQVRHRASKSWALAAVLLLISWSVWNVRDDWQNVIYTKHTELEEEPHTLTTDQISADVSVNENDSLFSGNVRRIISSHDASVGDKSETLNSKSFRTIEKIVQLKEDLLSQKKHLEEKLENLNCLKNTLESFRHSVNDNIEDIQFDSPCDVKLFGNKSIS